MDAKRALLRTKYLGQRDGLSLRVSNDRAEWISSAEGLPSTFFHSWEWLSWVAPLVDCEFVPLVVDRGSTTVGIAPILLRRRFGAYTANIVPFWFLGPIVPKDLLSETFALLKRW